jgi:uncharacterized protein with GYD domain
MRCDLDGSTRTFLLEVFEKDLKIYHLFYDFRDRQVKTVKTFIADRLEEVIIILDDLGVKMCELKTQIHQIKRE